MTFLPGVARCLGVFNHKFGGRARPLVLGPFVERLSNNRSTNIGPKAAGPLAEHLLDKPSTDGPKGASARPGDALGRLGG